MVRRRSLFSQIYAERKKAQRERQLAEKQAEKAAEAARKQEERKRLRGTETPRRPSAPRNKKSSARLPRRCAHSSSTRQNSCRRSGVAQRRPCSGEYMKPRG